MKMQGNMDKYGHPKNRYLSSEVEDQNQKKSSSNKNTSLNGSFQDPPNLQN